MTITIIVATPNDDSTDGNDSGNSTIPNEDSLAMVPTVHSILVNDKTVVYLSRPIVVRTTSHLWAELGDRQRTSCSRRHASDYELSVCRPTHARKTTEGLRRCQYSWVLQPSSPLKDAPIARVIKMKLQILCWACWSSRSEGPCGGQHEVQAGEPIGTSESKTHL